MANKWITVLAGFFIVIGCMIGIIIILFQNDPGPKPMTFGENKEHFHNRGPANNGIETGSRHPDEMKSYLANELEKLFTKDHIINLNGSAELVRKNLTRTKLRETNHTFNLTKNPHNNNPKPINHADLISLNQKSNLMAQPELKQNSQQISKANIPLRIDDKFRLGPHLSRSISPTPGLEPILLPNEIQSTGIQNQSDNDDTGKIPSLQSSTSDVNQEWEDLENPHEDDVYEDQYISDTGSEEGDSSQLDELFDLASNLYSKGVNASDLQGFLKVIKESVNRGNESSLLSQLNEVYTGPGILPPSVGSEIGVVGRNAYESSITAFLFMSFGIFLLNQIHSLMVSEGTSRTEGKQSRNLNMISLDPFDLNVLFEPPEPNLVLANVKSFANNNKNNGHNASTAFLESNIDNTTFLTSTYTNNMFRAIVNLVNAYTKNPQDLECIWSLYCHDLDQTSAQEGVYGIAARINSIGLRLIMHQISAELTMDVMIRSLLSWDGLPCQKMFPQCPFNNASTTLKAASVPESESAQTIK